jgi:predicted phosphodiesterase
MDIKHEIISALKQMALDLDAIPTRDQFTKQHYSRSIVDREFGSFSNLLSAAGVYEKGTPRKLRVEELFYKNIDHHIEEYKPREFKSPVIDKKILVIGDVHAPFEHKKALESLYEFAKETQPDFIIQVGDARDQYAFSKFPKSQNVYSPREEEELATKALAEMWQRLQEAAPKAKCVMLLGNHCIRPVKRIMESNPEAEHIIEAHLKKIMTFDNVETIYDSREEYECCGILFHHGVYSNLGQHRDHALQNMVVGHTHRGGVSYRRIRGETLWELNAGFIGDPESKVFSYTAFKKTNNYTLGWGYIDKYGPRFCHF